MANNKGNTQHISRLYHDRIKVGEAVEIMRDYDISAELVKNTYDQLSKDGEKTMMKRFHYYTIKLEKKFFNYNAVYWTSRYLLTYDNHPSDSAFHEVTLFDVFNNKSM
jgi:hypothetical protein